MSHGSPNFSFITIFPEIAPDKIINPSKTVIMYSASKVRKPTASIQSETHASVSDTLPTARREAGSVRGTGQHTLTAEAAVHRAAGAFTLGGGAHDEKVWPYGREWIVGARNGAARVVRVGGGHALHHLDHRLSREPNGGRRGREAKEGEGGRKAGGEGVEPRRENKHRRAGG